MIATVLAQPDRGEAAVAAKWRQLVDLLAQPRSAIGGPDRDAAWRWLDANRLAVEPGTRRAVAASLAGRPVAGDLFLFFAEDQPAIAAPLVAGAHLEDAEWRALLPLMSPTARALLRHRRDLGPQTRQGLAAFGASDFALGEPAFVPAIPLPAIPLPPREDDSAKRSEVRAPAPKIEHDETQIRTLVSRIEAFRRQRGNLRLAPRPPQDPAEPLSGFRWECGPDGVIIWVEAAPRGPLVGQSIATIADRADYGVDGQAAGAFEKRAPFRDARFTVPGSGVASGDWRISGVPYFEPASGAFLGYRGSARRPRLDELARPDHGGGRGLFGSDLPADALRQLVHELRTPLNAIVGFAEMIDGQYMGPAAEPYRNRAADIMAQANRLLSAVDDLDTAARIETSRLAIDDSQVDAAALLCRLHDSYERVAALRGSRIAVAIEPALPLVRVELGLAERMFSRMLAATIGMAGEGETIQAGMAMSQVGGHPMVCLAIDRPRAIAGGDERALLDPGYSPEGDWPGAPALGLGFALRLVRNLAEATGGALLIGDTRFYLYLPPHIETEAAKAE